jgi:hypothetical protein
MMLKLAGKPRPRENPKMTLKISTKKLVVNRGNNKVINIPKNIHDIKKNLDLILFFSNIPINAEIPEKI